MSGNNPNQQQRGGFNPNFNPNAASFVPNARAMPFVPGQAYQQPYGMPPPPQGFPFNPQMIQQQHMMQQQPPYQNQVPPFQPPPFYAAAQNHPQNYAQFHQQQNSCVSPMQAGPPLQSNQQFAGNSPNAPKTEAPTPAESWDEAMDEDVNNEPKLQEESKVEEAQPKAEEPPPPCEKEPVEKEPVKKDEPTTIKADKEKTNEEEVAVVTNKFRSAVVIDENRKERVNIVFIGHVDAGKSTIGGQIMYLTGMVDKRTLEKYEKEAKEKGRESWYLSWALDTNEEEREKGKTVEVGRAFFETDEKYFTILDAPGHKSFVPNMITGAIQADLAVLVISARKGEFETGFDRGGQTREHAMLVKTAGVKHLIILVNKMDDSTVNWDQERFNEIQEKLTLYLKKCGFNPKSDVTYIPCSGLLGSFLKERPPLSVCSWYTGLPFLDYIDSLPKIFRDFNGPVRAIVADKYSDMGTVVIGKLESGIITKGQNVLIMPNRTTVQVLQCWANDTETDQVYAGDIIKLKLKNVEESDILSGFVICSPDAPCRTGRVFDAEVAMLELKSIIAVGYSCVLHIHAAQEEVTVTKIICKIDKKTGNKDITKNKFVKQDEKCILRMEATEAFCLDVFANFPQMGRFTLRDEGKTIAIGIVKKIVE